VSGDFTAYFKGTKVRFAVLDGGGHQLLVTVDSMVRDFPQFSKIADRLLRSVRVMGV
jgi:hypothetical protein